ncbi:ead/Ea22-like family protein [Klebsiella michiganensis]|uniref:ead/Ea22-like family protein n=1 Tax=Klebsiella michiganensis TaxID=1134687 RepID=UPI00351A92E8
MNDITELAQSLKASAKKATKGQWVAFTDTATRTFSVHTPDDNRCENIIKWAGFDCQKNAKSNAEFIALANPANILALVEDLEKAQQRNGELETYSKTALEFREAARDENRHLKLELEIAEKRIAELESFRTAYMEWSDKTDWVQTDKRFYVVKPLGKHRADVLKAYIEHLKSRTVKLSKRSVGEVMHMSGFSRDYAEGWCSGNDNGIHEIRAAGIKVIEGEQKNG